jgi:hypothetical protein
MTKRIIATIIAALAFYASVVYAATTLTVYESAQSGATTVHSHVAAGTLCSFTNSGREIILARNDHASTTVTLTVTATGTRAGLALTSETITVAPSSEVAAGGFSSDVFNSATGTVSFRVTGTTVTLSVITPRGAWGTE